jgi:hypothetical protein
MDHGMNLLSFDSQNWTDWWFTKEQHLIDVPNQRGD